MRGAAGSHDIRTREETLFFPRVSQGSGGRARHTGIMSGVKVDEEERRDG